MNPSPERVTDELFQEFFDSRDLVQVKYEMLRRTQTEGQSVGRSAIDEELRTRLHTLATDFPRLCHDPNTQDRERKRLARRTAAFDVSESFSLV